MKLRLSLWIFGLFALLLLSDSDSIQRSGEGSDEKRSVSPLTVETQTPSSPSARQPDAQPLKAISNLTALAEVEVGAISASSQEEAPHAPEDSRWRFGTEWGRESSPELRAFSTWVSEYQAAPDQEKDELSARGVELAMIRRTKLKERILEDPRSVLASTVPVLVRNSLPDAIRALLEERVSGQGNLLVLAATPLPQGSVGLRPLRRQVTVGNSQWEAGVFGQRIDQRTTLNESLHGIAIDGMIALSESPLRLLDRGEDPPANQMIEDKRCPVSRRETSESDWTVMSGTRTWRICSAAHISGMEEALVAPNGSGPIEAYHTQGGQRLLVVLVDFPDHPINPIQPSVAVANLNQVDAFLRLNSFQKFWFGTIDATPVLRMPQSASFYVNPVRDGASVLLTDARAAAAAAGYTTDRYEFDIVAFDQIGFPWGGLGYVGWKGAWVQGNLHPGVTTHELGHNLGLWHAGSWLSSTTIGPGERSEYGNPFDTMGDAYNFPKAHFSANFRALLGWLPPSQVQVANGSGTYRIHAIDKAETLDPTRRYAIKLPVSLPLLDTTADYWIDYRQLFAANPAILAGAVVQWGSDSGSPKASLLLDTTPTSLAGMQDAPLRMGQVLVDSIRQLAFSVVGRGGSGPESFVDVHVETLRNAPSLGEAVDATDNAWTTGGATAWSGQHFISHDAADAAITGSIGDGEETWMEANWVGRGTLSFWWKVSSESSFDELQLILDGRVIEKISGEQDWRLATHSLDQGLHSVRWKYRKDDNRSAGADRGWVDSISFVNGDGRPVVYVDRRNAGSEPTGSLAKPYPWVLEGYAQVPACGILRVASGTYPERLRFAHCGRIEAYGGVARIGEAAPSGSFGSILNPGHLKAPVVGEDGLMELQFTGELGQSYEIFASADLVSWSLWKKLTWDGDIASLKLPLENETPRRFFKVLNR